MLRGGFVIPAKDSPIWLALRLALHRGAQHCTAIKGASFRI
jgi:hypothetical protein